MEIFRIYAFLLMAFHLIAIIVNSLCRILVLLLLFFNPVPGMMGSQIFKKRNSMHPPRWDRLPVDANHCLKKSAVDDLT